MPESVGMNEQVDWQAQQTSHLVCSLAVQRGLEAVGSNFLNMDRPEHHGIARLKE